MTGTPQQVMHCGLGGAQWLPQLLAHATSQTECYICTFKEYDDCDSIWHVAKLRVLLGCVRLGGHGVVHLCKIAHFSSCQDKRCVCFHLPQIRFIAGRMNRSMLDVCLPEEWARGLVDAPDVLQGSLTQLQLKEVPELRLVYLQASLAHHHTHRPCHLPNTLAPISQNNQSSYSCQVLMYAHQSHVGYRRIAGAFLWPPTNSAYLAHTNNNLQTAILVTGSWYRFRTS